MSITQEELQKYLDDPASVPADKLAQLAIEAGMTADPGAAHLETQAEPVKAEPAQGEVKQDETATAAASVPSDATKPATEQEAPILSKDGKHTIPYDVLASEREKRQAAEALVAGYEAKLAELQSGASGAQPGAAASAEQAPSQPAISEEELNALREDFPALAKVLEAQMAQVKFLESQVSTLTGREVAREAETARTVANTVQDMIDANPKLLHLQTKDAEGWNKIVEIDQFLQKQPGNTDMAARFDKAVAAYEAIHGVINAPTVPNTAESTQETAAQTAAAKAAAAKVVAGTKQATPVSLSDLPGGVPVENSEMEKLENMSAAEIGSMMAKMTPEQRTQYLSGL